jgi:hypothetical protein
MPEKDLELRVEESSNDTDYIAAIKELKENSVSKEDYLKVKDENKRLLQSLVNGETIEVQKEPVDISKLRKELFAEDQDINNVDFISKALELRTALIEQGEVDPFLPIGKRITPTDEDIATAERVANVLQECVDYAEGDSEAFTNELQRRTIDVAPTMRRR